MTSLFEEVPKRVVKRFAYQRGKCFLRLDNVAEEFDERRESIHWSFDVADLLGPDPEYLLMTLGALEKKRSKTLTLWPSNTPRRIRI